MQKKGFTLLELLIVIGILAILATAAVLVLNPAELLRQARDSTRVSDLAAINSSLALYLSTVAVPQMDNQPTNTTSVCKQGGVTNKMVYTYNGGTPFHASNTFPYAIVSSVSRTSSTASRNVNGTGWLPVNFNAISGGNSPLSNLPVDPVNTTSTASSSNLVYTYGCDSVANTFVITSKLESAKYVTDLGMPAKDGGPDNGFYEIGTAPALTL